MFCRFEDTSTGRVLVAPPKLASSLEVDLYQGWILVTDFESACTNQHMYRVTHLLVNLGWVDFDLGCFTILPSCSASSANFPSAQAEPGRGWNSQNQSQPNRGSPYYKTKYYNVKQKGCLKFHSCVPYQYYHCLI